MAVDPATSNIDATPGNTGTGLVDSTVLAGVIQTISDAILGKNHYTKTEVDALLKDVKDQLTGLIGQKADNQALTDQVNSLKGQIDALTTENTNLKNANTQLASRVQTLEQKKLIATVTSEDQVASQTAPIVIVDD